MDDGRSDFDWRRIQQLIDDRNVEEAIRQVSDEQVAEAWTSYHRGVRGKGLDDVEAQLERADWWANELWRTDEWWADEARVRRGLLLLIDLATTDYELEYIGIEHMEIWFLGRDESRLKWLEEQAAVSERFRRSLANLRLWGDEPDGVAARVESAAGVRLPRPINWSGP